MTHNQLAVTVVRTATTTDAVGIPVTTDKAVPAELGISREQLAALGFDGSVGQAQVVPATGKKVMIAVGVGAGTSAKADDLRTAAAALARAASKVKSLSTTLAAAGRGDKASAAQAVTEGLILATNRYGALKSDRNFGSKLTAVELVADSKAFAATSNGCKRGMIVGSLGPQIALVALKNTTGSAGTAKPASLA